MLLIAGRHPLGEPSTLILSDLNTIQLQYNVYMLRSISCFLVNRHAAEYGLCMCSDGPRAGLINEFSLPMWHCCDKQIPSQAGPFASGWFCVFVRASSFYDKDTTFPALCLCVWVRWVTRERKTGRVMTQQQHKHEWNSSSCLNPPSGN